MLTTTQESNTLQKSWVRGSELMPLSKISKTTGRAIQLTRPYSNSNSRGKEYQGHAAGDDESRFSSDKSY